MKEHILYSPNYEAPELAKLICGDSRVRVSLREGGC